jgi:uncharacterized membrane protein (DUF373 family)
MYLIYLTLFVLEDKSFDFEPEAGNPISGFFTGIGMLFLLAFMIHFPMMLMEEMDKKYSKTEDKEFYKNLGCFLAVVLFLAIFCCLFMFIYYTREY